MLPRLVLALVLAFPPFLGVLFRSLEAEQVFTLVIRMASSTSGLLQVFPDVSGGYGADSALNAATAASTAASEYRLPLKVGSYRSLRIDPGVQPGTYAIESVTVLGTHGTVFATIPLAELTPAHSLTVLERTADKVVFDCPEGSFDPQIVYTPAQPLQLLAATRSRSSLLLWLGTSAATAFGVIYLAQLALRRAAPAVSRLLTSIAAAGATSPHAAILVTALLATMVAMHPLLFFGRSLVSPSNGGFGLLYDLPPYNPASSDLDVEDVRETDSGAAMHAFVPYSSTQRRALAGGEWPLWNRYSGPGLPLWGQGQSFLFDPLHWLTLVGPDPAPGWDLKFAAHRLFFAWGIGVASMVVPGASLPAALLAAASAPFAGLFAFRINHPAAFTVTYAPWVLAAWFLLARATSRRERARAAILLAVASALVLLSAPPKEATMMLLVTEITGALGLVLNGGGARLLRRLGYAALAGVAAALLTAPHWLVFLDTLRASQTHYDNPAAYFAGARRVVSALVLGPLVESFPQPSLNVVSLVLVAAALLSPIVLARKRAALACAIGSVVAIALACGAIPAAWIVHVPLLANVHSFHTTFLTAALVPLLVLSASGAQALLDASRTRIVLITAVTGAVAGLIVNDNGGFAALGRFQAWLVLGAMIGGALIPGSVFVARRGFPRVAPVVATAALLLLLMAPGGQHLETGIAPLDKVLVQPRLRYPLQVTSPVIDAIRAQVADEPARSIGLGTTFMAGSQALYGIEGVSGPDALLLRARDELLETPENALRVGWLFLLTPANLGGYAPLLDLLNVRYLLARPEETPPLGRSEALDAPDRVHVVRRQTAWPRAYFVDRVSTYTTPSDLLATARRAGRPIAVVQRDDAEAARATAGATGTGVVVPADGYRLTANTTAFHVQVPRAGLVVLAESYLRGDFLATLNGESVPYFRVNHAFKGVAIPAAGDWEIRFEYRPRRLTMSLGLATAGIGLLLGLSWVARPAKSGDAAAA